MRMNPKLLLEAAIGLTIAVGVAFTGCTVDNRGSIALTNLCFPPTPSAEGCAYSAKCDTVLADGHLCVDFGATNVLRYPIEITNRRSDNSELNNGVNTNDATVYRFDMRYVSGGVQLGTATWQQSHTVPAGGAQVAVVELVPVSVSASLPTAGEFTVYLTAHGRYYDDSTFDTAEYPIPVTSVAGCGRAISCIEVDADGGVTSTGTPAYCPGLGQTHVAACVE